MKKYIPELDYLKSIFITLMILFHLVYIGDTYPYFKKVVYTFHMPIFLILSGYLSGANKNIKQFIYSIKWLFIPYAIMESGYVLAANFLPVREETGPLTTTNILYRLFVDPIGPYWYLHTLLICRVLHYSVSQILKKHNVLIQLILIALCYWVVSKLVGLMSFPNSMYFFCGIAIHLYKPNFISLFWSSPWSILPLLLLCCYPNNLSAASISGCIIVYLAICFSLWLYLHLPQKAIQISQFIGKNTLPILLFSPLFTMLSRFYQPFFMFEPTGICFAIFTLVITITGCLLITLCMDKLKISPWFFGQKQMLKK